MALSGTKALLVWSQRMTEGYKDVNVKDMQRSWKDGLAFCAILHHYRPDLIDFDSLSKENVRENNKLAFDVAEDELGIPALLDPDDMATMHVPDKLSIMTYVSQYYNYFKDKKPIKDVGGQKVRTPTKRPAGESPLQHVPNKQPSMGDTCSICSKKVFLVERQVADGKLYHRNCFRCTKCSTTLRPGSYKATANPKQFECLEHGDNIWKLRSNIAGRMAKEKASQNSNSGENIWETRPGVVKPSDPGSPWEKQTDAKTVPNAKPTLRDNAGVGSLWEARAMLKPVTGVGGSDGNLNQSDAKGTPVKNAKPDALPHKPQVPVASQQTPTKPAVPMHPHLLAGKAARERFNSPVTPQLQKPVTSPSGSASNLTSLEKRPESEATKAEETRQGLLASLATVSGNLKPRMEPSKEDSLDAVKEGTSQKLAIREESNEPSPAGSNSSLLSDSQQVSEDITSPEQQNESKDSSPEHVETKGEPESKSQSRDSGQMSSDVLSLTSVSSVSPNDNSEASSVDVECLNFASGIEPGNRSSAFSRNSFSDQEGNTGTNLNLSDSFCVEYNSDKVEHDTSATSDQDKQQTDVTKGANKEKEVPKEPDSSKGDLNDDYDESLNPFGDDEEESRIKENSDDGYKNPFDESDSEDDNAYDDSLNPFGDDDEEIAPGSPVTQWPPQPVGTPEIPNQQASYKVKTRQEILQEMQRDRHTLKKRRAPPRPEGAPPKLEGAPPRPEGAPPRPEGAPPRPDGAPPRPEGAPPRPQGMPPISRLPPRPDTTPSDTHKRAPPRSRKNRRAPTPPTDGGTQPPPKPRPDRPPLPSPSNRDQRTNSDVSAKPVPSPRLRKVIKPDIEDGRISPVPIPRKKHSNGLKTDEDGSPVPSPRMRRATNELLDKKVKPPRPTSDPIRPSSTISHGSRKRAPAPPPVKREVAKHHVDPVIIQKELCEIEIKQLELETKGVKLEQKLRTNMEGKESQDNEELLVEWFALVNEKNQLVRREGELVAQAQMQDLELQQAEIEYELRCLMHKHEHQKTDADIQREEKLLELLVEAVTKRSQIVERLEDDRKREEAEDEDIQNMLEQSGLDKKSMEKKQKKKKGINLPGI